MTDFVKIDLVLTAVKGGKKARLDIGLNEREQELLHKAGWNPKFGSHECGCASVG